MIDSVLTHLGRTTLAELWNDASPGDTLQRLGYTVAWSATCSFYLRLNVFDAEDFIVQDPDGQWLAFRVGRNDEDTPDMYWDVEEHRAPLLQLGLLGRYAGPCGTLDELTTHLVTSTVPRINLSPDHDWGAGKTLLAAFDLLDPDTRAATEMVHALTHPDLIESVARLGHFLANFGRREWESEAGISFAQAAARLWPTLMNGVHVPDGRLAPQLLVYPRNRWTEHATRITKEAGYTKDSAIYCALARAWSVETGRPKSEFNVDVVDQLMQEPLAVVR